MNLVVQIGRLTNDPEVRVSGEVTKATYTLAVSRKYKREGQPDADFIRCITFGKSAEFAEKYLRKGTKILVKGRIQTGSYEDKDGKKVYTTEVYVEEHEFVEGKKEENKQNDADGFMPLPEGIDEELPFA